MGPTLPFVATLGRKISANSNDGIATNCCFFISPILGKIKTAMETGSEMSNIS
jgi:hypothetical protein